MLSLRQAVVIAGLAVVAIIVVVTALNVTAGYLWFLKLGFAAVFWRLLLIRAALFFGTFLVVALYLRLVLAAGTRSGAIERFLADLTDGRAAAAARRPPPGLLLGIACVPALIFALVMAGAWDTVLRVLGRTAFGSADPIYGNDLGFYAFVLPALQDVQTFLAFLFALGALIMAAFYLHAGGLHAGGRGGQRTDGEQRRLLRGLAIQIALLMVTLAFGFYLQRYDLLTESGGAVFGIGFVEAHLTRWILLGFVFASLAFAGLVLWLLPARGLESLLRPALVYVAAIFLGLIITPHVFHRFVVAPNELEYERPYLRHTIAATRQAYGLSDMEDVEYRAADTLSAQAVRDDQPTIDNVRLWDWRPLKDTLRQLQEIRAYYSFNDVDVDRYEIDGAMRQVMLSARELSYRNLPAVTDTWVNRRLQYTHGYGLAMTSATATTQGGGPVFYIKDIPPTMPAGVTLDRPEIYYGETMPGYRIVGTAAREFDYPKGDQNVYTRYDGRGGVSVAGFWARFFYSLYFTDPNILISRYLGPGSRIQYWRTVAERVSRLAPFLRLDGDPYLVVSDGRLYWIQDTYTVAENIPYAEPFDGDANYVRNAVKAVINAYDGTVTFYVVDPGDPVIKVYEAMFPGLFRPITALPPSLRQHLRYPEDLFKVQVDKLNTYHITDPQVYYNREDVWTLPKERYAGQTIPLEPYYVLARLPGETDLQFLLMMPLTPVHRDNMIAWVAGRCDFAHYGKLVLYKLPKEKLFLGPLQIEAMIDQDTTISQRLTLWDQRGSRVIRGNLVVIPIDDSFLYIEPVYLQAEGANIPQLKRVIVSDGQRLAMEQTLGEAIDAVFGLAEAAPSAAGPPAIRPGVVPAGLKETITAAERALSIGDWAAFGQQMQHLKQQLEEVRQRPGADAGP